MPTETGITTMSLVIVPVSDQDASIAFYEGTLGLEKRVDVPFAGGAFRWVEVYAPDTTTGIAIAPPPPGAELTPQQTGITFRTDDIGLTHEALKAAGVDVDADIMASPEPGVPHMVWLRDPDGHTLLIVEPTA